MEEEDRDRKEGLRDFILSQIADRGPIPFAQFMDWCLYHPRYGYYQSGGNKIGKHGDYYTSPCVHPMFGHLVAKQLFQMSEVLGGEFFDVVEAGAGKGFLCQDILHWTKERAPAFYQRIRYHLIETAPFFLNEQRKRLAPEEREGKVFWLDPEALRESRGWIEGCFLSNELFDAFPVHRVILDHGELKEIYVGQQKGQLEERLGDLSDPRIASYFRSMGVVLQEHQKAEVNLKALEWEENIGRWLKRGFALTIDYGYLAAELYTPLRPEGTLLCYYQHQVSDNPYVRLGKQDITAHVDFTSLIQKGEEAGLRLTGFVPQFRFLIGLGLFQEMEALERERSEIEGLQLRLAVKHLIEPEAGMGEVFKVLIQHKGIENPKLDGLRELGEIAV
jgi:SAM-dependent MidA family methyltransferase